MKIFMWFSSILSLLWPFLRSIRLDVLLDMNSYKYDRIFYRIGSLILPFAFLVFLLSRCYNYGKLGESGKSKEQEAYGKKTRYYSLNFLLANFASYGVTVLLCIMYAR